jgi:Uma2 family endonuclease
VEYWIVDCKTDTIEVCREPQNGEYSQRFRLNVGDVIRPEAAPNHAFDVADITG